MIERRLVCGLARHPQVDGKLECFHQTLKPSMGLLVYPSLEALEQPMFEFFDCYNCGRYQEGTGDVTP